MNVIVTFGDSTIGTKYFAEFLTKSSFAVVSVPVTVTVASLESMSAE
jgi:hypothetical protein